MPTYVYKCKDCDDLQEVFHGMKEEYHGCCFGCGGEMSRKIVPCRMTFVKKHQKNYDPYKAGNVQGRSIVKGQKSGAPGIRMGFREGYKSALARYPGDPKAYVSSKREAMKRAAELGVAEDITFSPDDVAPD